jgi:hypothetical protein
MHVPVKAAVSSRRKVSHDIMATFPVDLSNINMILTWIAFTPSVIFIQRILLAVCFDFFFRPRLPNGMIMSLWDTTEASNVNHIDRHGQPNCSIDFQSS